MTRKNQFNFAIFFIMIFLLFVGVVFVFSASSYSAELAYSDKFFFVKKQLFGIVAGLICFIFFAFFDYKKLEKFKWIFVVFSAVLLMLVFVPGVGVTNYGATRWINLKFITFQPSEIAKFSFIIFSAGVLSKSSETIKSFKGLLKRLLVRVVVFT